MKWEITKSSDPKLKNPVFIEGLPGIGNVGKIVIDLVIDETKAKKLLSLFSYSLPSSVFVNENNLVELPSIDLYYYKSKGKDYLFLTGDVQPSTDESSYQLTEKILEILKHYGVKEIITLGGIGLAEIPEEPKVYCTGNNKTFVNSFKKAGVNYNVYGLVGPIMGISGVLLGLSKKKKMNAASLLAETYGHPMYIGLKGALSTLNVIKKRFGLKVSTKELVKEIKDMEREETSDEEKPIRKRLLKYKDTSYIG